MATDEFGGIIQTGAPAASGGQDEFGGIIQGGSQPAPQPTVDQKYRADPAVQAAADQYVKQKWDQFGQIAGQSQGQAIRDFAQQKFGVTAQPSSVPALDFRPEHNQTIATAYVQSTVPVEQQAALEDQWRQEFLHNALGNAVSQQTAAANAPKPEDVGLIHGGIDALLRGAANTVTEPVRGGTDLFYALGNNNADEGLHGANPNLSGNQLARNATNEVLDSIQQHINDAYKPSTNAAGGGFAKYTEGALEMVPGLALAGGPFKVGGVQKALAIGQIGAQTFSGQFDSLYQAAKSQGLDDRTASRNALIGGLASSAVNTYLMTNGALANKVGSSPAVKRILTSAMEDALAQGGVGLGQGGVNEVTKFLATGESASVKNVFDNALQNAAGGLAFGGVKGAVEGGEHTTGDESSAPKPADAGVNVPVPDPELIRNATISPEEPNAGKTDVGGGGAVVRNPAVGGGGVGVAEPPDNGGASPRVEPETPGATEAADGKPDVRSAESRPTPLLDKAVARYRVHNDDGTSSAVPLDFAHPDDRALYAATAERQGKIGAEAKAYLSDKGYTPEQIAADGAALRERVKGLVDAHEGDGPVKINQEANVGESVSSPERQVAPADDAAANPPALAGEGRVGVDAVQTGVPEAGEPVTAKPDAFLPEAHDTQRDQRDEHLGRVMKEAYVVKKGIGAQDREVLDVHKQLTGQEAIPYAGGRGRGFRAEGRTFYSVEKNNTPALRKEAIAHEATHWLQDNKPHLVEQIADAIPSDTREKLLAEYKRGYARQEGRELDPTMHEKEVQAMAVGRAFTRFGVARQVMDANPGAFIKGIDAVVTKLRSLTAGGRLTNQVIATLKQARAEAVRRSKSIGLSDLPEDHPIRRGLADLQGENDKLRDLVGRAKDVAVNAKGPGPDSYLPGGVDQFAKEDIIDRAKDVWDGVSKAWDGVKRLVAPQTRSDEAATTKGVLREHGAELAQRWDRLSEALTPTREAFDKLPVADTRAFIDAMEKGTTQASAALQPVADALRGLLDDRLKQVQGLGTGKLTAFIENYFPHLWKDPKKAGAVYNDLASKRPFEGRKSFLKRRSLPLFSDGIARGLEPVTENPVEAVMQRVREMDKYVTAQQAFQELAGKGLMRQVPARSVGDAKRNGLAQISDNIATVYAKPNRRGGLSIAGYWMAPEPVATVVNNYLSPGLRGDPYFGKAFRGYLGVGNLMNQAQLGISAFHGMFTAFDAAVGRMALGIEQAAKLNFKEAGKAALSAASLVHPAYDNFVTGGEMLREWVKPGTSKNPDIVAAVDAMKAAGGRKGMDDFYRNDIADKTLKLFRQGNVLGGLVRTPSAIVETAAKPILEHLVPRMKLGAFFDIMRREFQPGMTRDELRATAGKAWDSVDNRLGEMVYDNLFWNKAVKDLSMASVRAVGWNLGTIRELGGGTLDAGKALARVAQGKRPELTHRLAYTIALPLLTGVVGGLATYAMTGKPPQDLKDYYFPRSSQLDKDGHPVRFQMPGYMADVFKYGHDIRKAAKDEAPLEALTTLRHKTHPMLNTIMEMLSNEDYYGTKIRNVDDPFVKQLLDTAEHAGTAFTPFGIRDAMKLHEEGQGAKSLLPLAGIVRARTDITHTDAELTAADMLRESGHGPRTAEQLQHGRDVRELADSLHNGEPDAASRIQQGVAAGTLTKEDLDRIKKDQKNPDLLSRMVSGLDADQAFKVWDEATPDERKRIGPAVLAKVRANKTLPPERKAELIRRFQSDWAALAAP